MELATPEQFERVWVHMTEDFMPGEPLHRSFGFVKGDNTVDLGKAWKMMYKMYLKPMLNGNSVIALNDKDEIVGKQFEVHSTIWSKGQRSQRIQRRVGFMEP